MKQYVTSYMFNHNVAEISKRITEFLSENPNYSVHTISPITYTTVAGICVDAIVVYNIDQDRAVLDTPKIVGDVWDNGYRLPFNTDPIPCAKNKE